MGENKVSTFGSERATILAALEKMPLESRAVYLREMIGDDGAYLDRVREIHENHFIPPSGIVLVDVKN